MRLLWYPVLFAAATAVGCGSVGPQPPSGGDGDVHLSEAAVAQMETLIAEKVARTPAQRKMASSLLYARSGRFDAFVKADADSGKQIKSLSQVDAKGRVLVDVRGDMSALGGRIDALGGSVVDLRSRSLRAWMPLDTMEQLASESAVRTIRPAYLAATRQIDRPGGSPKWQTGSRADRIAAVQAAEAAWTASQTSGDPPQVFINATNAGSVISEGDKAQAADHGRRFYGVDGTGVKVGILSDSDDFKEQAIATGDLPANTTTVPGQDGRPGAGEGTAMMEIVHDLAPGADLFFATAFTSPESFADNIRTLRFTYHCDIIVDDVIYFFESPYQDDIIAQAVDDVTADGALYFSSAGNEGNVDDGTSGTWEGDFKPSGSLATLPASGYTVHSFGNSVIENRIEVGGGPLILHWSDPGTLDNPASSNDYDLFVLDNDLRNVVFASTDIQDGTGLPFEIIGFLVSSGLRVVIAAHPNAEVRALHTVIFGGEYANATTGSIYGHNSATDAFAVGAVDAAEAGGGEFPPGPTTPIELFSSDGPRRIFFDRDNQPINPANPGLTFASHGGVSRAKPDLSATDGVITTLPAGSGLNPFFGTSAAAPHAGAVAALIKSAVPSVTPAKMRTALQSGTIDIEEPSTDRSSGRGIVSAFSALNKAGAKPAVSLALADVGVTPLGNDALLPGGAAQLSVKVSNAGGAAATAVSATLTSSSPSVLILQGSSTFPTIPGENSASGSAFAFFVDSAAPCGGTLPFTLTVNFTGNAGINPHPAVFQFAIRVGRVTTTHVDFAGGPTAIPDASAAGVNVPITVSGFTGPLDRAVFRIDGTACSAAIGSTTVGLDHTFVGDLSATLRSPSGRTITLFSRPGGAGNSGNNFCQTVFDDTAAGSIQSVTSGQAPFTGTFRPAQPLSAFAGDLGAGTWILHVTDSAGLDTGSVRAVSLDLSGLSCTR
jgi:subtilase family protein/proprotein convertase P-domain-containing protein